MIRPIVLAAFAAFWGAAAFAEEGGSGHYLPGSMASFIDGVPANETFLTRLNVINYDGSVGGNVRVPIGGLSTLGADAKSWGYGLTFLWRPAIDLGERWSYAMSTTIPFVTMEVSGGVLTNVPGGAQVIVNRSDSQSGLGDLVLIPVLLNYNVDPDFNVNFRVTAYAPTGDYEVGRLANTGKNFWTAEPTLALCISARRMAAKRRCSSVRTSTRRTPTRTTNRAPSSHRWHTRPAFSCVRRAREHRRVRVLLQAGNGRQRRRRDTGRFRRQNRGYRPCRFVRQQDRRQGHRRRAQMAARVRNGKAAGRRHRLVQVGLQILVKRNDERPSITN